MFKPKLFTCLKTYSKAQLISDIIAGIIVAIIAIPLSVALGIASGVSPQQGLITAAIGGFIVSLLGGSRVQIAGPTGAFVVIVYGIVSEYGIEGLKIATMMAGIILVLMGLFKVGNLIKFIPYPITTGFTSGIAVVIFSTQIKDFLGLKISGVPADFIPKWKMYFSNLDSINLAALILGVVTILILVLLPKISPKIPAALIGIIVSTGMIYLFDLNVETIGSQFGVIDSHISIPSFSGFSFNKIQLLMMPAFVIAILGSVESLLSAVVADGMIGGNHRSNTELIAQGVGNFCSGLFGGVPVTGAIARTSANVKLGGRTPVAGIVHAIVVFLIMILFMPYFSYVPMATLAGILIVVSYNMGEWEMFTHLKKYPKSDIIVFLTTFLLTIIFDLVLAIEVGMVLSAFLFMMRMANISKTSFVDLEMHHTGDKMRFPKDSFSQKNIMYYEIEGPFFFGAADKFLQAIKQISKMPKVLIISLKDVPTIDATGYYALERFCENCERHKTKALFVGLNDELNNRLKKYGFIKNVGEECFLNNINEAKEYAQEIIGNK